MRKALAELKELFRGETVYIVGGGSSLKHFDFSKLEGKHVVGINQACVYLPNLSVIYWTDENWAAKNYDTLMAHRCKYRFAAKHQLSANVIESDTLTLAGATPIGITGIEGFDPDPNYTRGNNTGAFAIHLCIHAGARRIVLLGYDLKVNHWHNDYEFSYEQEIYDGFAKSIESIPHPGVEIINCSMNSALTRYPKVNFDDI